MYARTGGRGVLVKAYMCVHGGGEGPKSGVFGRTYFMDHPEDQSKTLRMLMNTKVQYDCTSNNTKKGICFVRSPS